MCVHISGRCSHKVSGSVVITGQSGQHSDRHFNRNRHDVIITPMVLRIGYSICTGT